MSADHAFFDPRERVRPGEPDSQYRRPHHGLSGKFRKLERGIMADVWIGNVQDDTSDDEIREFLIKYGFPSFDAIRRVEGTGTRPAVVVTFHDTSPDALRNLQSRIHNMFWKNRTIVVQVMPERDDS
jgi:RNA recognition motif-containing protein